ncbi:MAG: NAD(P)/FAD-dependent oxidoreductase [Armatimonadota bacterium]
MARTAHKYVIVGGGLAGASAIAGIREVDTEGTILLIGGEKHLPYDRPPLTKKLWFGKQQLAEIALHDKAWYESNGVELLLDTQAKQLDPRRQRLLDSRGGEHAYQKLLLATGGAPRALDLPGANVEGVCYYRTVDHYQAIRAVADMGGSALVVGAGFIGSELAAGIHTVGGKVTILLRGAQLVPRAFPEALGRALLADYERRGVVPVPADELISVRRMKEALVARTRKGRELHADVIVVGIGIAPATELARAAGIQVDDGIVVTDCLETSVPGIYSAGDNTCFPYQALGKRMRVEHWDNALNQGKYAGWNMAGRRQPYDYMPYFFSDLFEFGYEAVGEIDPRLEVIADWQKENEKGVIYFLKGRRLRGAMMCNVWDQVPAARELIRSGRQLSGDELKGAIR